MNLNLQAIRNRRRDDQDIAMLCDELERLSSKRETSLIPTIAIKDGQVHFLFGDATGAPLLATALTPDAAEQWADSIQFAARRARGPDSPETWKHPAGKISPDDEGVLNIAVGHDDKQGVVVIEFGASTNWVAMEPGMALDIADMIRKRALILQEKAH